MALEKELETDEAKLPELKAHGGKRISSAQFVSRFVAPGCTGA